VQHVFALQRTGAGAGVVGLGVGPERARRVASEARAHARQVHRIERVADQVRGRHQGSVEFVFAHQRTVGRGGEAARVPLAGHGEERRRSRPAAREQEHHLATWLVGEAAHRRHGRQHGQLQLVLQPPGVTEFLSGKRRAHQVLQRGLVLPGKGLRLRGLTGPDPTLLGLHGDLLEFAALSLVRGEGLVGGRLEDRLGLPVCLAHLQFAQPLEAMGAAPARPTKRLPHRARVVRPRGEHLQAVAVERDGGDAIHRPEFQQVLFQAVEHAVPVALDREEVVDEDEEVRAGRRVGVQVRHSGHGAGRRPLREPLRDLGEVADRHRLAVDQEFEVRGRQTVDPVPFPVGDDDFGVDDPDVDHFREDGRLVLLLGRRRGRQKQGPRKGGVAREAHQPSVTQPVEAELTVLM